jgi:hypothetical protein
MEKIIDRKNICLLQSKHGKDICTNHRIAFRFCLILSLSHSFSVSFCLCLILPLSHSASLAFLFCFIMSMTHSVSVLFCLLSYSFFVFFCLCLILCRIFFFCSICLHTCLRTLMGVCFYNYYILKCVIKHIPSNVCVDNIMWNNFKDCFRNTV